MNWEQRYRLRHAIRSSLVLWSVLSLLAALLFAPVVRWIERDTGWVIFNFSPEGARAVLGALVGSMLTFIVFVLSATLIVVQLASGQLTPRVIAMILAMPRVKATLALLTFTYADTLEVIGQVYPLAYDPGHLDDSAPGLPTATPLEVIEATRTSGVVMAFSVADLVRLAQDVDAVIELVPQVGDFVAIGDPLFRVCGGKRSISSDSLRGYIAVGAERTLDQDPRFAFRIIVDVANKALSPGINDPTTAVLALDQIHDLLLCIGRRQLDDCHVRDREGKLRLVYGTPDWNDYLLLAVSEIRQYGASSLQVNRRLQAMLDHLIESLPEPRRSALQEEQELLRAAAEREFHNDLDRKRARIGDYQGVGGSDQDAERATK